MQISIEKNRIIEMLRGGAVNLEINKVYIDSLNVFPVPDGDTGTNMNLTMQSAIREMDKCLEDGDINEALKGFAKGALKGARGNSGVILSQIIKGIVEVLIKEEVLEAKSFAKALRNGCKIAYDVVTHPKEGTILTVIRLMSDFAVKSSTKKQDFLTFFSKTLNKGTEVLNQTPDMLPVLKKAGVVDAGGKGLLEILTGLYNILAGIEMATLEDHVVAESQEAFTEADIHDLDDIHFAYCTEYFIINLNKQTTISDIDKLRDKLTKIGDCVLVVGDLSFVKVHVHTNTPDKALTFALALGELDKPKIENMLEQNRELRQRHTAKAKKEIGLVAIAAGDGLSDIFKSLHADAVLEGGQTMNPSVSDIVSIVDSINAENVIILPNNKNIVLASEQARELTKANLIVIPTRTVPEGVSAAANYNPAGTIDENLEIMQSAAYNVKTGQVTHAVRDTEMDGLQLVNGDIIGIVDKIIAKGNDIDQVTLEVINNMMGEDNYAITLYYGEGQTEESAKLLASKIEAVYSQCDVMVYKGGQPHYYYFIAIE